MTFIAQSGCYGASKTAAMLAPQGIVGRSDLTPKNGEIGETKITSWLATELQDAVDTQLGLTLKIDKGIYLIALINGISSNATATFSNQGTTKISINGVLSNVFGDTVTAMAWPIANQTLNGGLIVRPLVVTENDTELKVYGNLNLGAGNAYCYGYLRWIRIA